MADPVRGTQHDRRWSRRSSAATALVAIALALAAVARPALAQPGDAGERLDSTYRAGMSDALAAAHVVEVPLVPLEGAELLIGKPEHMKRLGFLRAPLGRETWAYEDRALAQLALRRATDEEVRDGKVKYVGLATRYHDHNRGRTRGSIQGDGKAAIVGDLVLRDPRTGRIEGIYEIQLKGVDTGLRPKGTSKRTQHGTGAERMDEALRQALMSEYLIENGVRATDWVAVLRTGRTIHYRPDHRGGTDTYQAGILVRAGSLLRIAHLQRFRDDKALLRELVDHVNREASRAAGRRTLMTLPQLYRHLTIQKADQLARFYFARGVHGSLTLDNIGLFEHLDLGTTATVTGADGREGQWRLSPGFAHEHEWVLPAYYEFRLHDLLTRAAESPRERKELRAMRDRHLGARRYRSRLVATALERTGLDPDDVAAVLRHRPADARRFGQAFERLARAEQRTRSKAMKGLYDVFGALGALAAIAGSSEPEERKVEELLERMGARGLGRRDRKRAVEDARALLRSFAPVLEERMRGLSAEERATRLALVADDARRMNRPVALIGQRHARTGEILQRMTALVEEGDLERMRAEWRAWVRANTRTGAQSPRQVAMRVRRGEAERTADGRLRLTRLEENGVEIQELSGGAAGSLLVTLAGNPLDVRRGAGSRMEITINGRRLPDVTGRRTHHGSEVFEVALDAPLDDVSIAFRDPDSGRRWDNAGFGFGRGMEWSLGSPRVRAELAARAGSQGRRPARAAGRLPRGARPADGSAIDFRRQTLDRQPPAKRAATIRRLFGRGRAR